MNSVKDGEGSGMKMQTNGSKLEEGEQSRHTRKKRKQRKTEQRKGFFVSSHLFRRCFCR